MKYQKIAEATGYLSANKIANKVTKVSRRSPQNNSNENDKEIPKQIYIYISRTNTENY